MHDAFDELDGDEYYERNKDFLGSPECVARDIPLKMMQMYDLRPKHVREVGCADGWRLEVIRSRYGSICEGSDISAAAIRAGRERYPAVFLYHGSIAKIETAIMDLVICSYVLHWVSRPELPIATEGMDRLLRPNGLLLLADFAPDEPTNVPYKHRPGLFTYKRDYASMFTAMGYRLIVMLTYNHDTHEIVPDVPSEQRGMCALLEKEK